jgi:hypothetical protein
VFESARYNAKTAVAVANGLDESLPRQIPASFCPASKLRIARLYIS